MKAGEIQVIKDFVDKDLMVLIAAEAERLPLAYQPAVKGILAAMVPSIIAFLDGKLSAIVPEAP